ncbi:nucleotide exchange factor GrpE [Marinobacterium jannaschii]|uniref:nucleotide exchange factor GrpE n=1 Tax=Marinobacterium jannaschii TaxID=64970 RepID=UPI000489DEE3|nr:nucleotide exchange factor GrpE [Marinobacterium jannaschii]
MANEEKTQADVTETPVEEQVIEQAAESDAAAEQAEATELPDAAELATQLAAAQAEIAELKDQMLRVQAESQNIRRRAEMDVEKAHKFGLEKFANELLPLADNLERALESAGEDEASQALREGVEMTLKMFIDGMAKFSLDQVNPMGETFDPQLHQAMSMVPAPDAEPNTVIAVMQKGYTLHGRLIRPAMVMVAKGE